jgi:hypothetical protein
VFKVADLVFCHVFAARLRMAAMASRPIVSGSRTLSAAAVPSPEPIEGKGSIALADTATRINKEERAMARIATPTEYPHLV